MLTLILGPMFSGKSTYLLRFETSFLIAKKRVMLVKHVWDQRYSNFKVATHAGQESKMQAVLTDTLSKISDKELEDIDVVLLDEGQFFPDLSEWCKKWSNTKLLFVAGLSGDYKQEPFKPILDLVSTADRIVQLFSVCYKCGDDAPFTIRISNETEQCVIGKDDKYKPSCRKCIVALQEANVESV